MTDDDDQPPLSGSDRDLLRLATRDAPDGFLMSLISMARQRLREHVGLLVNGMIVIGEINEPEALASLLQIRRGTQIDRAERPTGISDAEWEEMVDDWISEPMQLVKDLRRREAELEEELGRLADDGPPRSREIPAELERQLEAMRTYSHITLTDVTITAPGVRATTSVPVMRIAVRQIAGWWLAPLNEDGTSSINLWDGEPRIFED